MTPLRADAVVVACAISAGIHGALVPEHLRESAAAGGGFAVSVVLLGAIALWLSRTPTSAAAAAAAALVLAGLLGAYALAVTTGVPLLHPEPEAVDGLALFTKAVELLGLAAAVSLLRPSIERTPTWTSPLHGRFPSSSPR